MEGGSGFAFAPKGNSLVVKDGLMLKFYDSHTGHFVKDIADGMGEETLAVCFDTENRLITARPEGDEIVFRDVDSGRETARVPQMEFNQRLQWASDRIALIQNWGNPAGIISQDVTTGESAGKTVLPDGISPARRLFTATPNGQILAYVDGRGINISDPWAKQMRTTPIRSSTYLFNPRWDSQNFYAPALCPTGETIAVSGIEDVNFQSPVSKLLARAGIAVGNTTYFERHRVVRLFDTATGEELASFSSATDAAFSPDGKTLAVAKGNQIELWDYPLPRPPKLAFAVLSGTGALVTFILASWWRRQRRTAIVAPSTDPAPLAPAL
jgi:WD40 repeat protein